MSERERVLALAEQRGYGQLVKVASPSYSNEVGCILPMGLVCVAAGVSMFVKYSHAWYLDGIEAVFLIVGLGILAMLATPWVQRRPGGSEPRLYCFVDGVVVAIKSQLTSYRWDELTIEHKDWERGSDEYRESGTQTTIYAKATGAVVAEFTGIEPVRAGATVVARLHKTALERVTDA